MFCVSGHYCPSGSFGETACEFGTYQNLPSQGSCLSCPAGNFCNNGTAPVIGIGPDTICSAGM